MTSNDRGSRRASASTGLLLAAFAAATHSFAQAPAAEQPAAVRCGATDAECLEAHRVEACTEFATYATCLALLTSFTTHPYSAEPEWLLEATFLHFDLADLASDAENTAAHERAARDGLESFLQHRPDGPQASRAYVGLATLAAITDDVDGQIAYLRQAVAADPNGRATITALARALGSRRRDRDLHEAADLYREAAQLSAGNDRWLLAGNAHALYVATGEEHEAQAYREEVFLESGMAAFPNEIEADSFRLDAARQEQVLATACSQAIVSLFGVDTCLRAIRVIVETVDAVTGRQRTAMQTAAAKSMQALLPYAKQHTPEMRRVLAAWFDEGSSSTAALVLLADLDNERSIPALERALELEAGNADYEYDLALLYRVRERRSRATRTRAGRHHAALLTRVATLRPAFPKRVPRAGATT